jgi:hypothetical protein
MKCSFQIDVLKEAEVVDNGVPSKLKISGKDY